MGYGAPKLTKSFGQDRNSVTESSPHCHVPLPSPAKGEIQTLLEKGGGLVRKVKFREIREYLAMRASP